MSSDRYQKLVREIDRLAESLDEERSPLVPEVTRLQSWFQTEILGADFADLDRRRQSYTTEIHKQLRLLATDAAFLQSARQETKQAQRRSQIRDRLSTIRRYCNVILGKDEEQQ
ncbi:heterocyst frequency control protein PatD [Baaleninema sp.]|uniref:heterocyst frequency control protein PatD n=1 Tax=Baaleninema sp. TaxID=3101197 RepID=UPI003CFD4C3F